MNFVIVDKNKCDLDLLMDTFIGVMPECQVKPFTALELTTIF